MLTYILTLLPGFIVSASLRQDSGEFRLYNDIVWGNNPYERPRFNKSQNVTVEFDFYLRSVSHFNEAQQLLVCTGWFIMTWMDEFLKWDPTLYNGTEFIRPPVSYVWTPDIVAANSFQQLDSVGGDFVSLKLYSSGLVEWVPGDVFNIPCDVDIQRYPFDSLVCYLELVVWTHSVSEVSLEPMKTSARVDQFKMSGQWSLLATSVTPKPLIAQNITVSRVSITMILDRTPTNFVFSFILPVLILSLLGTFVFLIPSDSGEKISFAITMPLSYGVYMGFLNTMVPQTSREISVFVIFLSLNLMVSAVFVVLSIFSVRIASRREISRPIPVSLQKLTTWVELIKTCGRHRNVTESSDIDDDDQTELPKNLNEQITWKRVSKALDMLFFWIFGFVIILSFPVIFSNVL